MPKNSFILNIMANPYLLRAHQMLMLEPDLYGLRNKKGFM